MGRMIRRIPLFVVALAALLASEPLLHEHPLDARSDSGVAPAAATCVVCAAGVNRLPDAPPSVVAPTAVEYSVIAIAITAIRTGVALTLPSRAPPAA